MPLSLLDAPWMRTMCSRLQLHRAPIVKRRNAFGCTPLHAGAGWAVPDTKSVSKSSMNWNRRQPTTSPDVQASGLPPKRRLFLALTCSFNTLTFIPAYRRYSSRILLKAHRWSLR